MLLAQIESGVIATFFKGRSGRFLVGGKMDPGAESIAPRGGRDDLESTVVVHRELAKIDTAVHIIEINADMGDAPGQTGGKRFELFKAGGLGIACI